MSRHSPIEAALIASDNLNIHQDDIHSLATSSPSNWENGKFFFLLHNTLKFSRIFNFFLTYMYELFSLFLHTSYTKNIPVVLL